MSRSHHLSSCPLITSGPQVFRSFSSGPEVVGLIQKNLKTHPMRYLMNKLGPLLGILVFAAIIIATALSPSSCASANSSDRELSFAQAGLSAARIAYSIARAELATKLADPTTPPLERQLAAAAAKEAGDALTKEQARVDKLIADRAAAKIAAEAAAQAPPASPLLPAP